MSCFLCSDKHIATIAKAYVARHPDADAQEVADTLLAANAASVRYCYGSKATECDDLQPVDLSEAEERSDLDLAGLVACLDYQSCDMPEWIGSDAARLLDDLEGVLPHYSESDVWSI